MYLTTSHFVNNLIHSPLLNEFPCSYGRLVAATETSQISVRPRNPIYPMAYEPHFNYFSWSNISGH
jgi:hypothetical protein